MFLLALFMFFSIYMLSSTQLYYLPKYLNLEFINSSTQLYYLPKYLNLEFINSWLKVNSNNPSIIQTVLYVRTQGHKWCTGYFNGTAVETNKVELTRVSESQPIMQHFVCLCVCPGKIQPAREDKVGFFFFFCFSGRIIVILGSHWPGTIVWSC